MLSVFPNDFRRYCEGQWEPIVHRDPGDEHREVVGMTADGQYVTRAVPEKAKRGPRFYELLAELRDLHDAKAHDYAPGEDRFLNFRQCEALGVPAYEGAVIRMTDKMSRLTNLIKRGKGGDGAAVADESLVDTLRDLACYSLITIELYEQSRAGTA